MITEGTCVDVVRRLFGRSVTMTQRLDLGDAGAPHVRESSSEVHHGMAPSALIRELLVKYSISDVDGAIRWLELGEYISYFGYGISSPKMVVSLTQKGVRLAETGRLEDDERRLVYQENPYSAFIARQFRDEDTHLFEYLRDSVLSPLGIEAIDGRVDGIEAFRGEIIQKIRLARYFICILTHRSKLSNQRFASSVWLYQETGAAVALGKKPLILVENGMDEHYAGELQKNYEYETFTRADFKTSFTNAGRRLESDLLANHIPLRNDKRGSTQN